jgi:hypothetical protein
LSRNPNIKTRLLLCELILLLASPVLCGTSPAQGNQTENKEKETIVIGRVLASFTSTGYGSGIGPKYETFIFGVESKGERGEQIITPVEIAYAFQKYDQLLPQSFFDHSKLYELHVRRAEACDVKVSALSWVKNEDPEGKQLPSTYILKMTDGAPSDLFNQDSILPCYTLYGGNYR